MDISKLLESRDSKYPVDNRSAPPISRASSMTSAGQTTPCSREFDAPIYQAPTRINPLSTPQSAVVLENVRSPPKLPPLSSIQPRPLQLQPSPYHSAQPFVPPVPQYVQDRLSLSATLKPAQPSLIKLPLPEPNKPSQIPSIAPSNPLKRRVDEPSTRGVRPPEKRHRGKWTPEEDNIAIELRNQGMKWEDIAKHIPGRSAISCRLRYQNYSEKRRRLE